MLSTKSQKAISYKFSRDLFYLRNTIRCLLNGFEGWLYHLELLKRPPRHKASQGTKNPNQAFWVMLDDKCFLDWKWYYDPEF